MQTFKLFIDYSLHIIDQYLHLWSCKSSWFKTTEIFYWIINYRNSFLQKKISFFCTHIFLFCWLGAIHEKYLIRWWINKHIIYKWLNTLVDNLFAKLQLFYIYCLLYFKSIFQIICFSSKLNLTVINISWFFKINKISFNETFAFKKCHVSTL